MKIKKLKCFSYNYLWSYICSKYLIIGNSIVKMKKPSEKRKESGGIKSSKQLQKDEKLSVNSYS